MESKSNSKQGLAESRLGKTKWGRVRTRMAPSPTGEFHIGSLRTLLYNWAWAKKNKGEFIIRIEDTDRERFVEWAEERTLEVIKDYGLDWDEGPDIGGPYGPYRQSERLDIYKKWAQKLIDSKAAYYCFCTKERLDNLRKEQQEKGLVPKYDRHCLGLSRSEIKNRKKKEPFVVRLKIPDNEIITFNDTLRGEIKTPSKDLDDQILLKSDGYPTYHLGVVVDDILMKVTHVIRGEEWLPSTPKHVLLYKAFGHELPVYTHVTVLLNPDGKGKLSKRHGGVSARYFLDEGYLPEAVLNFLMLLGWAPKDNREFFTLDEFIKAFDLDGLQLSSPSFNRDKLLWMNGQYIQKTQKLKLKNQIYRFFKGKYDVDLIEKILPLVQTRIKTLKEFEDLAGFFFDKPNVDIKILSGNWQKHLKVAYDVIEGLDLWKLEELNDALMKEIDKKDFKTGEFFMDLRIAVSGKTVTPPINDSIVILGKDEVLERIRRVLEKVNGN